MTTDSIIVNHSSDGEKREEEDTFCSTIREGMLQVNSDYSHCVNSCDHFLSDSSLLVNL